VQQDRQLAVAVQPDGVHVAQQPPNPRGQAASGDR
jgi:hypothetical protein